MNGSFITIIPQEDWPYRLFGQYPVDDQISNILMKNGGGGT